MPVAFWTSESNPRRERPWSLAPVGRERDGDDARPDLRAGLRREPEPGDAARAVALHEHVRLAQQCREPLAVVGRAQIERGRKLAATRVGVEHRLAREMRRRDAHDIGAVGRERAAADRAGNDAGEIEHAQARERAILRWARQRARGGLADPLDFEQGQPRHRHPLRVRLPFRRRAVERGDEAGFRHRGLELCALPLQRAACTASRS